VFVLTGTRIGHAEPVVVDDFESGVGKWILNDTGKTAGKGRATLCNLVPTFPGCTEGGGKGAALLTYLVAPEGWATASIRIRGQEWQEAGAQGLSFWLKGDGSLNTVQIVLSAFGDDGSEWSFSVTVPLSDATWHRVELPLSQFKGGGYSVLDKLADVRLLQIAKANAATPVFLWVDEIQAETVVRGSETPSRPSPAVTLTAEPDKPKPAPGEVEAPAIKPAEEEPPEPQVTAPTAKDTTPEPAKPAVEPAPVKPVAKVVEEPATVLTPPGSKVDQPATTKPEPKPEPVVTEPPQPKQVRQAGVSVDFSKVTGTTKLRVGGALGAGGAESLNTEAAQQAIAEAAWHLVRVRTSELIDSADEVAKLEQCCNAIRAARAYPVICVDGTRKALLSGEKLAALGEALVRKLNVELQRNVLFWEVLHEPTVGGLSLSNQEVLDTYWECARRMQTVDPHIRVGGVGFSAPFREHLNRMLQNARTDFLSFHFYGTHNNSTDDADLLKGARAGMCVDLPDQALAADVAAQLGGSKSRDAKVFITECGVNSVRREAGQARDARVQGLFGATWLTTLLTRLAPHVDEVLLHGVGDASWGVLDKTGKRLPSYWAAYLFNAYCPLKSDLCRAVSTDADVVAFAVRTDTSANVFVINTTPLNAKVTLTAKGLGKLDFVRGRRLDLTSSDLQFEGRPLKDAQTVWAKGYSVNVVQFVTKKAVVASAAPTDG
jgi:hypothetical protein